MGQWGNNYRVHGAEFLVHLDTGHPFGRITENSVVDMFMLSNSSGNSERDTQIQYHLNKQFVGKYVSELDTWYLEYQDRDVPKSKTSSPWAI